MAFEGILQWGEDVVHCFGANEIRDLELLSGELGILYGSRVLIAMLSSAHRLRLACYRSPVEFGCTVLLPFR